MSTLLRRCHECGQPLGKKDVFCPRCGAKQRRDGIRRAAQRAPGRPVVRVNS